jgi:hypothetical protein
MKNIKFKGTYFIIVSNTLVKHLGRLVSLGDNAMAITFWPFIIVRFDTKDRPNLIRHETIHIRQQIELFIIGAHLFYLFEYFYARFVKKLDKRQVYYYTATEQEAHRNASNIDYLKERKPYAVLKYIKNKKHLSRGEQGELIEKDYA